MPSAALARLVSRCRGLSAAVPVPDCDLLRRFAWSADPDAFAELVGRYAVLVWGVCRRTLPQEADAEDAFQATFLALARGARAIDPKRLLGAWLHAVAVRVSRRALGKTLRRRADELPETVGPADVVRDRAIHLWDTEAGKVVRSIRLREGDEAEGRLEVSADGKRVALCLRGGAIAVFDPRTGNELRRVQTGGPVWSRVALTFSPDGSLMAVGLLSDYASVRVWEVDTGKERLAGAGHHGPAKLTLSADGKTLVSRGAGEVFHWDLATGEGKAKPDDVKDPDGWDRTNVDEFKRLRYRTALYRFTIDWDAGQIEVRSRDGAKRIARAATPKEYVRGYVFSADGRHLAVSFQDRGYTVLLWTPGERPEPFRLTGHPDACQQMTFTHDGKYLIAGAGTHNAYATETVFVYETATGKRVRTLPTRSAPGHLLLTADDKTLITGGWWNDATFRAYDLATGRELATLLDPAVKVPSIPSPRGEETPSVAGLALSADERFLAVLTGAGGKSSVSLWDTGSWKLVKAFPPAKPRCDAASLAVGRGGRSVFVAYTDSTILEWDVAGRAKSPTPSAAKLDELWRTLGDPEAGYAAAWELGDHPAEAVAFLRTKLAPAVPPDAAAIKALVRQLGSDAFRDREAAEKKLVVLGESAVPVIRAALAGDLSAEGKERAEKVVAALSGGLTAEQLRQRRAVAVLEWSERADADEQLRKLAAGDPTARQTNDARAAAERRGR